MQIDRKLLKRCLKNDRKAQFVLYKTCYNMLMSICIRYKNDEGEAKAVLNLAFLKILKNLEKYRTAVPFEAWIRRITINTIIDEYRKNKKDHELIQYQDFSEKDRETGGVDLNAADQLFDAEALEDLIRKLPPASQQVFNLYAIDGYNHKEIGALLNISEGTSKWHLSEARKKLQAMLNKKMNLSARKTG